MINKIQIYKDNKTGINFYKSSIISTIEPRITDIYISVVKGDRLDILSNKYYQRVDLWKIIAIANNIGLGSMFVPESMQLRIPTQINEILSNI